MSIIETVLYGAAIGGLVAAWRWPRRPKSPGDRGKAAIEFAYRPGEPQGYAMFTDRYAMSAEADRALSALGSTERLKGIFFAVGFLEAVIARLVETAPSGCVLQCFPTDDKEREMLAMLVHLQQLGTDNAEPSTSLLRNCFSDLGVTELDPESRSNSSLSGLARYEAHLDDQEAAAAWKYRGATVATGAVVKRFDPWWKF